jgi:hypothetical protein
MKSSSQTDKVVVQMQFLLAWQSIDAIIDRENVTLLFFALRKCVYGLSVNDTR